jgi:hypothetical protein
LQRRQMLGARYQDGQALGLRDFHRRARINQNWLAALASTSTR